MEARPWPHDRYECESVNLLGIGGANVHVIVDSAARFTQTLVARISYMGVRIDSCCCAKGLNAFVGYLISCYIHTSSLFQ
ncbi:hypothetical protein F4801DRAFT_336719 [Xylaria longipes]|nr:hypothetical protein F4801DRAFT_336719 [Xylaria longipes]